MPKMEISRLTEDQINEEKPYIYFIDDGKSIKYPFVRSPSRSRTIYFTPDDPNKKLEVVITVSGPPERRDPTIPEMEQFMNVMKGAYPQNQMTLNLRQHIITESERLLRVATGPKQST